MGTLFFGDTCTPRTFFSECQDSYKCFPAEEGHHRCLPRNQTKDLDELTYLLRKKDINNNNKIKTIHALIKRSPTIINKNAANGQTPLLAAADINDPEFIRILVSLGAKKNIKSTDKFGETPLIKAARLHMHLVVKELLKPVEGNDTDINATDANGNTALLVAQNNEVFHELLKAGADENVTNKEGKKLIDITPYSHFKELLAANSEKRNKIIERYETVEKPAEEAAKKEWHSAFNRKYNAQKERNIAESMASREAILAKNPNYGKDPVDRLATILAMPGEKRGQLNLLERELGGSDAMMKLQHDLERKKNSKNIENSKNTGTREAASAANSGGYRRSKTQRRQKKQRRQSRRN